MKDMSADALAKLGQNALAFGKTYAALKDALIKQGVEPKEAVSEARNAATIAALSDEGTGEQCPLCGK